MLYYISLPFFSILLIIVQSTITDIIFSNYFVFEISIVVVIYAGFHLDIIKGTILALILGVVLDCVGGSVLGVFAFIYMNVFWFSFFASDFIDTEKTHIIVFFSVFCVVLKGMILNSFHYLVFDAKFTWDSFLIVFIQALVIGLIAPVFFYLMDRSGVLSYEKKASHAQRT